MKPLTLALKDTLTRFRDRNALLYMLAAPLMIGLIMGAAFGGQNDGSSPIYAIPVAVVNADEGDLGQTFADILSDILVETAEGEQPLFAVTALDALETARAGVENGDFRGAVYLPSDFSAALSLPEAPAARIELYTDPTATISPPILRSVVFRIAQGFESAALGGRLAATQAAAAVRENPQLAAALAQLPQALAQAQTEFAAAQGAETRIRLHSETVGAAQEFDIMGYFMPSMAIFFLTFAMFAGTRSILEEEKQGTLPRLLTTPTRPSEILLGKIGGTLLTGLLQMAVLVLVSALLFGVDWGAPLGVALLTLATIVASAGLGALVAAFARDDNQAGIFGTLLVLVFAILGGNFLPMKDVPPWLNAISKATLNRWALDGFTALSLDGLPLSAILPNVAVLFALGAVFFVLALLGFRRRFTR
ncbi:MAG TPA: ABC-2 transporter permease [Chloroflexi bacterium]|nr:ABC-2 transporter permease [Chloroflexota bacterium]